MSVAPAIQIMRTLIGSQRALPAESVAQVFEEAGWSPCGTVVQPFPKKWCYETIQATIEEGQTVVQFLFHLVAPHEIKDLDQCYSDEMEKLEGVRGEILESLSRDFPVESTTENREEYIIDFIESSFWRIRRSYLSIGVAHPDEYMPILLLAKIWQE